MTRKRSYAGMDAEGKENDPLYRRRHSLAHVLAQAVQKLYPGTRLGFGPPVDNGFYYDFQFSTPPSPEDLPAIEEEMRRILAEGQAFEVYEVDPEEAVSRLTQRGEHLKAEYCQELAAQGETLTFYRNGPFEDLCAGPHVANTREIPPDCFRLDHIAGAYWRGDEKRGMLTRIYGLCFANRQELEGYLRQREEAKKYDHRKLGKELEIFLLSEEVGAGLPLWLPNGTVLRDELEALARETEQRAGYVRVATPHLAHEQLFALSGHLEHYREGMFPPMEVDSGQRYYLKPMNCPLHHIIFRSRPRSYRELPLRLAEYGQVYRYEPSGTLAGLLRVRGFCQNDAHIYCTPEQLEPEFRAVLDMHLQYYNMLRISSYWMRLSTHDPEKAEKFVRDPEAWRNSEETIRRILDDMGVPYEEGFGEAAFYGPKVDFQIRNVLGREETASTNQLDFAIPARFGLEYTGSDGARHVPYCIHRAPLGSHERFVAFLLEHFKGAFPTWLAPIQVRVVPVSLERFGDYGARLVAELRRRLFRAELDEGPDSFNKKIRQAATAKIPNVFVVGGKEAETEAVTWRRYAVPQQRTLPFAECLSVLEKLRSRRIMDNFPDVELPEA
ncbi:MAG TPA: threonine--tRNA ligase [Candidatus Nitrosotenuis sp.]|nr:threonine--tRNA ligase [Candidatus Nitrosotenuis sp.]